VGAGLLAKAVDQPLYPVTDTAHSRASPLPHLDRLNPGLSVRYRPFAQPLLRLAD